jgi:hypothetical protein
MESSHCWWLKLEDSASARNRFISNGFDRRFSFLGTLNYDYEPRDFPSTEHTTEHAASLNSPPNAFVSIHEHALLSAFLNLPCTSYPHASYVVTFSSHVLTDPSVVSLTLSLCNWEMFHIFHYVFNSKSFQPSRTYNWRGNRSLDKLFRLKGGRPAQHQHQFKTLVPRYVYSENLRRFRHLGNRTSSSDHLGK